MMITTNVNGIDIKFPFEPYDIQKDYMGRVIECLSMSRNGVLESPTGTGKTLSLLCASLAWLEAKKAQVQLEQTTLLTENQDDFFMKKLGAQLNKRTGKSFLGVPTIIYASRTHSQLSQAVSEMRLTAYNYMKACVIGSREQMCVHSEVVKEQNNSAKIAMCNLKVKTRTCNYYNNLTRLKEDPRIKSESIVDIEDLVTMGKTLKFCPYFMAKEFKAQADIIFMPYNYLLEPKFRKSLGIELGNTIIILDEGHNVEKMCEETASLQIKSTDIALAIEEVTAVMKMISEQPTAFDDEGAAKDFSPEDLVLLKQILMDFEKELDAVSLSNSSEGTTFGGLFIFELFEKAGINVGNHQILINLLERLVEYLSVAAADNPFQRKGNALKLLEDALAITFMEVNSEFRQNVERCYKVHIVVEEPKKKERNSWLSKATSKTACRILSFWCFSPGFGMKMLLNLGIRCCILTSGTLAPLKPLISELEFVDPVNIENPHVVKDTQLCVRVISNGPDSERLSCTFQNRDNENYLRSLGFTIMNVTRLIPNGLLIFFPSYPILNNCMTYWQKQGIWSSISEFKPIYTEPRDKISFSNAMNEYYEKINDPNSKGAIFMGVCRGKVSEGLDFADLNGRGVIIVGLPFPPLKDPRIILKKRYLDNCNKINKEFIGGDKWYTLEACRAVNQAIGRVIRHKNDYGAILLLDERFKNFNIQSQLSSWLRNRIKLVNNFGEITRDLRLFYKNAAEQFPVVARKKEKYVANLTNEGGTSNQWAAPTSLSGGAYNCFKFESSQESIPSSTDSNNRSSTECSSASTSKLLDGYKRRIGRQIGMSKRLKIKLVPNPTNEQPSSVSDDTKEYIAMVRKALDVQTFKAFVGALQTYQTNKNIEELKDNLDKIFFSKHNLRYLLQGVERYVDKSQKESYREYWEKCRKLM